MSTLFLAAASIARAADVRAVDHSRTTIYHSPQTPGFTSWCGAWVMPDGGLMISFTQATGPVEGRPRAPQPVRDRLNWPPGTTAELEQYDMTGLDLRNVHLLSTDGGDTWRQVSADAFRSCLNGVSCEAETALSNGTVLRGVHGFYLPYNPELPQTGFLQRSSDGTRTWSSPQTFLDPERHSTWPRRLRVLYDGRIVALVGVAPMAAGHHTRIEFSDVVVPTILVSQDEGRTWSAPIPVIRPDQVGGWTEEFDVAELTGGDLLCVFRRRSDAHRWQSVLKKAGDGWSPEPAGPSVLPHSGQPELLATREGPVLHVATSGVHWTSDAGASWTRLDVPGSAYYPRSVQLADGRVVVVGHIGGDDAYGSVDQSIVMDRFRLEW